MHESARVTKLDWPAAFRRRHRQFESSRLHLLRARETSLVALSAAEGKPDRACRDMIGPLVEIDVGSQWRRDLERQSNRVRAYRWTPQFLR